MVDLPVPLHVALDLRNPKIPVGVDVALAGFPIVPMPEGAVDKNHQFIFEENDIWLPGEFFLVAPVAQAGVP